MEKRKREREMNTKIEMSVECFPVRELATLMRDRKPADGATLPRTFTAKFSNFHCALNETLIDGKCSSWWIK